MEILLLTHHDQNSSTDMTEQQEYRVIKVRGVVELREYAPWVVADVVASGSAEQAGSAAFRPLFEYISGANRGAEPLAMTAPVTQEAAGAGEWTVSFVLPAGRSLSQYPTPTNSRVSLRAVPGETAAAIRWSGRWTSSNIARRTQDLRRVMAEAGWQESGEPRWARFDPPWKPPFARRNEIVIPVHRPGEGSQD